MGEDITGAASYNRHHKLLQPVSLFATCYHEDASRGTKIYNWQKKNLQLADHFAASGEGEDADSEGEHRGCDDGPWPVEAANSCASAATALEKATTSGQFLLHRRR